jgi:hypothetical protein
VTNDQQMKSNHRPASDGIYAAREALSAAMEVLERGDLVAANQELSIALTLAQGAQEAVRALAGLNGTDLPRVNGGAGDADALDGGDKAPEPALCPLCASTDPSERGAVPAGSVLVECTHAWHSPISAASPADDSTYRGIPIPPGVELAEEEHWWQLGVESALDHIHETGRPSMRDEIALVVAMRLLEEVLHLRMNGERAPGGSETWAELDPEIERFLRAHHADGTPHPLPHPGEPCVQGQCNEHAGYQPAPPAPGLPLIPPEDITIDLVDPRPTAGMRAGISEYGVRATHLPSGHSAISFEGNSQLERRRSALELLHRQPGVQEYLRSMTRCSHDAGCLVHPDAMGLHRRDRELPTTRESTPQRKCPDDGVCHHGCAPGPCFRVKMAGPLSGAYPDDDWPQDVRQAEANLAVEHGERFTL